MLFTLKQLSLEYSLVNYVVCRPTLMSLSRKVRSITGADKALVYNIDCMQTLMFSRC